MVSEGFYQAFASFLPGSCKASAMFLQVFFYIFRRCLEGFRNTFIRHAQASTKLLEGLQKAYRRIVGFVF